MKKTGITLFCMFLSIVVFAQLKPIKGSIIDETGEPVIGASILVKGTATGTTTDVDGRFSLTVATGKVLIITYIGYERQEVKAQNGMRVRMKSTTEILEGIVVTGMSRMDKRLFTGATDKLNASDAMLNGIPDISRSLEGRSAGVSVQNVSGTFGTAPKIRVRGATSIYGSSKPLWVIDGVIMEDVSEVSADDLSSGDAETLIGSAIAGLNSDDIESFQILKDGSATSIYGARAMAGVIVVTTKKGKAGQSHINYTSELTYRLIPSYRNFNILNSQDQMGIYKEMKEKGWLNYAEIANYAESGVYGKMYELMNTYDEATGQFLLRNDVESQNGYLKSAEMRNTNWFKELFNENVTQNHSVSISSGNEKASYYASLSAMIDPGWYKESEVNRYTANLNANYRVLDNVTFNMIAAASYRKQKAPGTLSQDVDVVSGKVKRDFDINPYSYALNSSRALDPSVYYTNNYAPFNILHELESNYIDLNVSDLRFQGELRWKVIPELELSMLGAVKYSATSQEHNILDDSNQAEAYRAMGTSTIRDENPLLYTDPDNPYALPISILPNGGIYKRTDNRMNGYDFRTTASWNHIFNGVHILNLFGGMELNSTDREKSYFNGWGMQYSKGEIPFYVYEFFKKGIEDGTDYYSLSHTKVRNTAFFGNATYSYRGKYTFNGTYRYEGTNGLGKARSSRWLPTWNLAGSWNVHEETFFNSLEPTLSHLTIKASYSLTADRGPREYANSTVIIKAYNPYRPFSSVKESGLYKDESENSELTYEKKHELNLGFDAGFLNNRINVAFDWYKRDNFDLIGPTVTTGTTGDVVRYANTASMRSNGEEFTVSTKNIVSHDFKWSTNFIFSHTKNTVTDLMSQAQVIDLVKGNGFAMKGYPVRSLFSIPFQGLTEDGLPTFTNESANLTITDINFQERNKLSFLKYEGPTDPTITGSMGNIFSYKNMKLNVFVTYSFGNVVRLNDVFDARYNDLTSMTKEFKNRWEIPGDENYTNVPVLASRRQYLSYPSLDVAYNAYNYSDIRVAKGDFVRMKEISLAYDFPQNWLRGTKVTDLSLKLQATNLFLIYADSKLNGQDPEFFRSGGVAAPVPKQFTFTLKLGF
jgi:TonB-linked SusC/RagA family outer membrane protein